MIYEGSRYEKAKIATVASNRAGHQPTVFRETPPTYGDITVVMRDSDSFESFAHRLYGDPELWWVIADANPQVIYPDQILAGTVIRIPSAVPQS